MNKLQKQFNSLCNKYAEMFAAKHELPFEGWVGFRVGEIAYIGDYYVGMSEIRYDIDTAQPPDIFFRYQAFFDKEVGNEKLRYCETCGNLDIASINYETFCKI